MPSVSYAPAAMLISITKNYQSGSRPEIYDLLIKLKYTYSPAKAKLTGE